MAVEGEPEEGEAPRLMRWLKTCPASVKPRITRARTQRLYLISRTTDAARCHCPQHSQYHSEFAVLGSTGNVYQVRICTLPSCDCPDSLKGSHCKHILFVMLKVLRVDAGSRLLFQNALLPSELARIFAAAPADPALQAHAPAAVRKAYAKLTGEEQEEDAAAAGGGAGAREKKEEEKEKEEEEEGAVKRKDIEGNDCAICYEPLSASDQLEWCATSCGNNLHKDCFSRWSASQRARGEKVTCVYCRAEWVLAGAAAGAAAAAGVAGAMMNEGYTNLAQLTGQSTFRSSDSWFSGGYGYRRNYRWRW